MPTLTINGKKVKVDESFLALTPEQQDAVVDEIAASMGVAAQDKNQPEMRAREVTLSDRAYDFAKSMGLGTTADNIRRSNTEVNSAVEGLSQGFTGGFSDELIAGLKTGFGFLGDYGKAVEAERARMAYNKETSPNASMAGEIGGAIGLGTGMAKSGLSLVERARLASLPRRVAAGAVEGAAYGSLYGAGTGEGVEGKIEGAGVGAGFGAGIGAGIPIVGATLRAGYNAMADQVAPYVNAVRRPAVEAERRAAEAAARTPVQVSPWDEAAAVRNNQQILNVDRMGEGGRAMARSVANQNPEARAALERTASDRFASQGQRAQGLIDRLMGGQVDDVAIQADIRDAARRANAPRYRRAYAEGENLAMTPELERLTSSPAVVKAMRSVAMGKGQDRAVAEGAGAFNPGVTVTPDGRIVFQRRGNSNNAFPNLQFWDYVKRELDDMAGAARRSGANGEAGAIEQITRQLRDQLDAQVPSYLRARQGAARFFEAEDALEAGKKFVSQQKDVRQALSAMGRFTPEELMAFRTGFAAELRAQIGATRDRANVIDKIFGSQQSREKIRAALGQQGYAEFETFTRMETLMDRLRGAVTGNSTTARQIAELGLGLGAGYYSGGDLSSALTGAALVRGLQIAGGHAAKQANQRVMTRIADILLSDDPQALVRGSQELARTQRGREAVRQFYIALEKALLAPATSQISD